MQRSTIAVLALTLALTLVLTAGAGRAEETHPERAVPSEGVLWEAAGQAYANGQDKSAAMQQYRLYVKTYGKSPRAAQAQFMVGECYFATGDFTGALKEYREVGGRKGADDYLKASVLLRQGECLYNLARYDEAIEKYDRLIDKYDDTFLLAEGMYEIGLAYIVQGNWLKLGKVYRELLERRPGYAEKPQVKFALGLFAYQEQNYEEAIAHFEQVNSDRGLYYLGRCLEDTGQYILAIQRYRQVLRRYPDSPLADDVAFSVAEAFYRSGQNAVAVRSYRAFLEKYPESRFVPNARYKMACVTYNEGRFDESLRQLEEIVRLFPGQSISGHARYLMGDCHLQLGRRAEAIFAWTDVVKQFGETRVASAALHKVVFSYTAEQNYSQAILMANEFLDRYPGDALAPRVRVLQGFSHFELGEYREAIRAFQNVLDKHVNTEVAERALFLSTLAYFRTGEMDRLVTNYNYLASKLLPTPSPWRARTYYYLGEAYYSQGLYRQSEGMYRLVLTGYPRSNVAAASLQGLVASLSRTGDYELALAEQEKFLLALANAESEKGTNALAVGSIYFNQHKYEEALAEFSEFLAAHPDDPMAASALANQGDCYYRLQYYEQAIASWQQLLNRFGHAPEAQEALYRIADTQFGLGRFADAAGTYSRLVEHYPAGPHTADARFGLANCAYNTGQDDAAIAAFEAFVAAYPQDPRGEDAELGIQSCYYRSGKDMVEYLDAHPDSPLAADIYWNKGQDAFAAGDFSAAARAFEKVTLDYPDSESGPGALFYLAESYYRSESMDQALAGYRNFTVTHPDHDLAELAYLRAATVEFKGEKYLEAAQSYELLTDIFPEGQYAPLAAFNAAICYQEVEDWHAAIGGYVRFLSDHPDNENAAGLWLQIANLYKDEVGDFAQAVQAYDQALAAGDAGVAEVRYRQGECREKENRPDLARQAYRACADEGGTTDPFRIAALARLGEMAEERGDWSEATRAWQDIKDAGGKPEWGQMATERLEWIRQAAGSGS